MTIEPSLSALVYGPSGYGKSWVGATTPPARLIIDLEGRADYTPNGRQATHWDGISNPMELEKSPTRTYIVTVTDVSLLDSINSWLWQGIQLDGTRRHPWHSVTVDSLMFAQMRTANALRPGTNDFLREQDWGTLLRKMERLVLDLHDMTRVERSGLKVVVFLAGSALKNGSQEPMMQGQIGAKLPYLVDMAGYLDNARNKDTQELVRQLVIEPYPDYGIRAVKDGTHIIRETFGGVIADPSFERMYEALRGGSGVAA